ncbi:MAG: segregation/condensation protein A [Candidatus Kapabacteria bacterium]|nr:segregation/condensation protein A [Candidatus Kapabacteria bacterium]
MYKIVLPNFSGPFDLLLYLIKKEEVNIYDIPIAKITREFLNYVRLMRIFDLDLAGEFLVMASTLMYIKIKLLLPKDETTSNLDNPEDPVTELTNRLLEYKKIKHSASELAALAEGQRYTYYRKLFEAEHYQAEKQHGEIYKNATIFDLLTAFNKLLSRANQNVKSNYLIQLVNDSVDDFNEKIFKILKMKKRLSFMELCDGATVRQIVVSFLSILDLLKKRMIFIKQSDSFDEIIIAIMPESKEPVGEIE